MLLGLLVLARAPMELAEAEVAVGDEGAHLQFLGERECYASPCSRRAAPSARRRNADASYA
jgi:hypothetical protein